MALASVRFRLSLSFLEEDRHAGVHVERDLRVLRWIILAGVPESGHPDGHRTMTAQGRIGTLHPQHVRARRSAVHVPVRGATGQMFASLKIARRFLHARRRSPRSHALSCREAARPRTAGVEEGLMALGRVHSTRTSSSFKRAKVRPPGRPYRVITAG